MGNSTTTTKRYVLIVFFFLFSIFFLFLCSIKYLVYIASKNLRFFKVISLLLSALKILIFQWIESLLIATRLIEFDTRKENK